MNLLVISGSPRKQSNSLAIAQTAVSFLKSTGSTVALWDLQQRRLPIFDGEEATSRQPEVSQWILAANRANGFFIVTPEYHNGMSGALKNALDFLGSAQFNKKPVAMACAAGGGKGGINALNNLRLVIRGVGGLVLSEQCIIDQKEIDDQGKVSDNALPRLEHLLTELTALTRTLSK
ncbi:NADPH-dependent FMN reductase [Laceyella putida]|uniref:NADPH-dependent FMN reductase n=1 Tax=Laceyella putida TaxID=110101 RepID=A0ABW2RJ28_9BACL